jgi:hypothetical protein
MSRVPARVLYLALLMPLLLAGTTSCDDGCDGVDCGSGLVVYWSPGDLPAHGEFRLCVDDRCEMRPVEPVGDDDQYLHVSASQASGGRSVRVLLEAVDPGSGVPSKWSVTAEKHGSCCPGVELLARPDGTLIDQPL